MRDCILDMPAVELDAERRMSPFASPQGPIRVHQGQPKHSALPIATSSAMARRKRFLDDDSSDDSDADDDVSDPNEDPDTRAERLMHQDPYQRGKRRRKGRGKDSATYGVFGDDSDEEDPRAGRRADISK
jgi:hypothetical protein